MIVLHSNILCHFCFKTTGYRLSLTPLVRYEFHGLIKDLQGIQQGVALLQSPVAGTDNIAPFAGLGASGLALSGELGDREERFFAAATVDTKPGKPWR